MKHIKNAILNGEVVILPTETVYGLLCLESVQYKLFELKNRPSNMQLARVYASVDNIETLHQDVMHVIMKLLPGPFTIIDTQSGLGVRVPDHNVFQNAIAGIAENMVMTSANLHGQPPAITFIQAKQYFSELIGVDGGECKYKKGSTLVTVRVRN